MQGAHASVIQQVGAWLESSQSVWLCTVIRTFGSAPRPLGSMMAFCAGQGAIGSVSGGCIEEALFEELAAGTLLQRAKRSKGPGGFKLRPICGRSVSIFPALWRTAAPHAGASATRTGAAPTFSGAPERPAITTVHCT